MKAAFSDLDRLLDTGEDPQKSRPGLVLCFPGRDAADEVASMILAQFLKRKGFDADWAAVDSLAGELLAMVEVKQPAVICISALPPHAVNHSKYLCKRLRSRFPKLPILVGLWETTVEVEEVTDILLEVGADRVVRR